MKYFFSIIYLLLLWQEIKCEELPPFFNYLGDNQISDSHPEFKSRGFYDEHEYFSYKIDNNQAVYVNSILGNLIYHRSDFTMMDLGFPIIIDFYYNSGSSFQGRYGNSWQFSYNIRYITNNYNRDVLINNSDDRNLLFSYFDRNYQSENYKYKLESNEDGYKFTNYKDKFLNNNNFSEYFFNGLGNHYISLMQDKNFNKIYFVYNHNNQLIQIKFPTGRTIELNYDNNYLESIEIPKYGIIHYSYDTAGNLTKVNYPTNDSIQYEYDSNCGLLKRIIKNGKITEFHYNSDVSVSKVILPDAQHFYDFEYHHNLKETKIQDINNEVTFVKYDNDYRTTQIIKFDIENERKLWDNRNRLISYTDANGNITKYSYDNFDRIIGITNSLNHTKKIFWDDKYYNLREIVDEDNNSYVFDYDNNGNLIRITDPEKVNFNISYLKSGIISKYYDIIDTLDFLNDGLGKFNRIILNNQIEFDIDYDNLGEISRIFEVTGFDLKFEKDYFNNEIKLSKNELQYDYKYDYEHNITSILENKKKIYLFGYDKLDRLISFSQNNRNKFDFTYFNDNELEIWNNGKLFLNYQKTANNSINIIYQSNYYQYFFNLNDKLSEFKINNLRQYKINYNALNYINEIIINDGLTYLYNYNPIGLISSIQQSGNIIQSFFYDKSGRMIENRIGNESFCKFEYSGNETRLLLPNNNIFTYQDYFNSLMSNHNSIIFKEYLNDNFGYLNIEIQNEQKLNEYRYNGLMRLSKHITCNLDTIENIYSSDNNLKYRLINRDTIRTFVHDDYRNLIQITNSRGDSRKFKYDNLNNIILFSDELNYTTNFDYKNDTIKISKSNANFLFIFTPDNKLSKVINPQNHQLNLFYNNGLIERILAPENVFTTFGYDSYKRINKFTNSLGHSVLLIYDNRNNIISITNQNGFSKSYKYNLFNKPVEIFDFEQKSFQLEYFSGLYLRKILMPDGDSLIYFYNNNNQISQFRDYNGNFTQFEWNCNNCITSIFNDADKIQFIYGRKNQLISKIYNNLSKMDFSYDNESNLRKIIFEDSLIMNLNYDKLNRIINVLLNNESVLYQNFDDYGNLSYSETWGNFIKRNISNDLGLTSESNGIEGLIKFNYDNLGRLIFETYPDQTKKFYEYDRVSRLNKIINIDGFETRFNFDKLNNIEKITFNSIDSIAINYYPNGKIKSIFNQNNQPFLLSYNKKNQITKIEYLNDFKNEIIHSNLKNKLTIKNNVEVDKILEFDSKFRIIKNMKDESFLYQKLGLITIKNQSIFKYDNFYRLIENINNGFAVFYKYKMNLYTFDTINLNNNIFKITTNILGYPKSITYNSDIWSLNYYYSKNLQDLYLNNSRILTNTFQPNLQVKKIDFDNINPITYNYSSSGKIKDFKFGNVVYSMLYNNYNNLNRISLNNNDIFNFFYDPSGNLIISENASRNQTEYIYNSNNRITQKLFEDAKFSNFLYNKSDRLTELKSNLSLKDSITFKYSNDKINEKSINYFDKISIKLIFSENNLKLELNNKLYNLFTQSILNNNRIINIAEKISFHEKTGKFDDSLIFNNGFEQIINFADRNKLLRISCIDSKTNQSNVINFNHTYYNLLSSVILNDTNIIEINYDNLWRINKYSNQNDTIQYDFNEYNLKKRKISGGYNYDYIYDNNLNLIKFGNTVFSYDQNGNRKEKTNADGEVRYFYDNHNRLIEVIKNNKPITFNYDSEGNLASMIDEDTIIYIHSYFKGYSITTQINSKTNSLTTYFCDSSGYNTYIIDHNNSNPYLIVSNGSGLPLFVLDSNGLKDISNFVDIYGYPLTDIINFNFFYKGMMYFDNIGLYYQNGSFYDPETSTIINNKNNHVEGISLISIQSNNPLRDERTKNEQQDNYLEISQNDIYQETNPINNEFINFSKGKILDETINSNLNQIFNNFKTFKVSIDEYNQENLDFHDIKRLRSQLSQVNPESILNKNQSEVNIFPILDQAMVDRDILNNLQIFQFKLPKLPRKNFNQFGQIIDILKFAEIDSSFILSKKLSKIMKLLKSTEIDLPDNFIEPDVFKINFDLVNDVLKRNDKLSQIIDLNLKNSEQKDNLSIIYNTLTADIKQNNNTLINQITGLKTSPLTINTNANFYLPLKFELISESADRNRMNILNLLLKVIPENYNPSKLLYEQQYIKFILSNIHDIFFKDLPIIKY